MKIKSTRFGELDVAENDVIHFSQGLPGFPEEYHFALLPQGEESPFFFLQSTQDPNLTFLLVDPFAFFAEYHSKQKQQHQPDKSCQKQSMSLKKPHAHAGV